MRIRIRNPGYFKVKHKFLEGKLEFKGHYYMFHSYEMELYSVPVSDLKDY